MDLSCHHDRGLRDPLGARAHVCARSGAGVGTGDANWSARSTEGPWDGWDRRRGSFAPAGDGAPPDAAEPAAGAPVWIDPTGLLAIYRLGERFRLVFHGQLAIDCWPERRLLVEQPLSATVTREAIDHFVDDLVYPRVLAWDGAFVLHGAAVRVGDAALIFLGPSGRGKSTLTASFDRAGCRLLGDDALVIAQEASGPAVRAVLPSLRLLPDSLSALFPDDPVSGSIGDHTVKRWIEVGPLRDGGDPVPDAPLRVAGLFILDEPSGSDAIRIAPATPSDGCMAMIGNSFELDPTDRPRSLFKLERASRFATAMPCFRLDYPRRYDRLAEVRAAILGQVGAGGVGAGGMHGGQDVAAAT